MFAKLKHIQIPKALSLYSIAQGASLVLGFIGFSLVSRYLGPINLGLYSFAQNFLGVFLALVNGLELYYTWKVAGSDHRIRETKTFLAHKLHITLTITLISIVSALLFLPTDVALLCIVISLPLFLHSCTAFTVYSNAEGNAKIYAQGQILSSVLLLFLRILLVQMNAKLVYIVLLSSFDLILTGIFIRRHYLAQRDWKKEFDDTPSPTYVSSLKLILTIRYSVLAFFFWQLILRADQLMLATFTNAYTLGVYAAAAKIAEVPNFIAGILYVYTIPKFGIRTKDADIGTRPFFKTYKKIILTYLAVSVTIMLGIIAFAPLGVRVLYGSAFAESVSILRVYALSIPPLFLLYFFFSLYSSMGRYKIQTAVFALGLAVNLIAIRVGFDLYGILGVAAASAISYSVLVIAFTRLYNRNS